ncbi:hypothetical protein SGUI_2646 [Serinicoccus hydrothermalis]|uniref:Uncharacterized protein n=1 Tax=Serinicoccus hydrothermalis TaxID=1758689 RepID=A0A1B1NF24_9MICO|nr:hypothetical protein SGUI_2646 [Serinicoccus hydrothermalis]
MLKEWGPLIVHFLRLMLEVFFPEGAGLNQLGPLMEATGIEEGPTVGNPGGEVVEGEIVDDEATG